MENYIKSGNAKIWTEISGNQMDKYAILCSGGPGCCDYLLPVSQMIDDGYNVIRFEQRGCGHSDKDGKYDLETTVSDIETISEFYGINSWIVGGLLGALISRSCMRWNTLSGYKHYFTLPAPASTTIVIGVKHSIVTKMRLANRCPIWRTHRVTSDSQRTNRNKERKKQENGKKRRNEATKWIQKENQRKAVLKKGIENKHMKLWNFKHW